MKVSYIFALFSTFFFTCSTVVQAALNPDNVPDAIPVDPPTTILGFLASQPENFTILATAATTIPALAEQLNDPKARLTLFPPTDQAFIDLASTLLPGEQFDLNDKQAIAIAIVNALVPLESIDEINNPTLLSILTYHALPKARPFQRLESKGSFETVEGSSLKFSDGAVIDADPTRSDPVPNPRNVLTENGWVHVIDSVLLPFDLALVLGAPSEVPMLDTPVPEESGVDVSEADGIPDATILQPPVTILRYLTDNADQFRILITAAGLIEGLVGLLDDPTKRFTLFAPTDDGFINLTRTLVPNANLDITDKNAVAITLVEAITADTPDMSPSTLETILSYHLLGDAFPFQTLESQGEATTAQGESLTFNNGAVIDLDPSRPDPIPNPRNLLARNGWVHVIDNVLLPFDPSERNDTPSESPVEEDGPIDISEADDVPDAIIPDPRPTILGYLASLPDEFGVLALAAGAVDGLTDLLNRPTERLTLFAPNDEAFAKLANQLNPDADVDSSEKTRILETIGAAIAPLEQLPSASFATLGTILTYHLLTVPYPFQELQEIVTVETAVGSLTIDDNLVLDLDPSREDASVVRRNVFTQNGWVHVIDSILLPFNLDEVVEDLLEGVPMESPMESPEESPDLDESPPEEDDSNDDDDDPVCFSSTATVRLEDGSKIPMSSLQAGYAIHIGSEQTSKVFAFTHRTNKPIHNFFALTTASGHTVAMTAGHYLYANGKLTAASAVRIGDVLRTTTGASPVVNVKMVKGTGLYAPHTIHGDLEVDGVIVSGYSRALHPSVAHALLAPVRALSKYGGVVEPLGSLFYDGAEHLLPFLPRGASRY